MKNKVGKAKTTSILATVLITIASWFICGNFTRWISEYLIGIFKPMSTFALAHPIFALSIGHIPYTSYLVWKRNPKAKYLTLLLYWIFAWCLMILITIVAFVLADHLVKPHSPLLPEYIVWLPFINYWNVVLPLASVTGHGVLFLIRRRPRNLASTPQIKVIDGNE